MFSHLDQIKARRLSQRAFFAALILMFATVIVMIWLPQVADSPVIKTIFAFDLTLTLTSILIMIGSRMNMDQAEKSKRGLEGLDMYTVIDRLVADLDEDEAAYLQRRLDERGDKAKHELTASLGDLLDQRAEARRTNDQR